jgi:hypothetical protein
MIADQQRAFTIELQSKLALPLMIDVWASASLERHRESDCCVAREMRNGFHEFLSCGKASTI